MDPSFSLRQAQPEDGPDFSELFLISAPFFVELFKDDTKRVLKNLFVSPRNLFSFQHVCFAEIDGQIAGMILSYSWETHRKEYLRTGRLFFRVLGFKMLRIFRVLLRLNAELCKLAESDYYISNLAVYPRFRGIGIGRLLMEKAEEDAKKIGSRRLVLEVEESNTIALSLYRKLGFEVVEKFRTKLSKDHSLNFCRMIKPLV
uniref:GNAT family N-acetyltransferase n=1 Tax=Pseudothermotoga hypogea TaxID=57487 RepID=A0A832I7C5_9THEM